MKLESRIFICFVLTLILIFLTGCHSVKWEWLPSKDPARMTQNLKPPFTLKGTKMDGPTPEGITILKGSF
tara:strand:+ start:122 stop:331 length:210 start_codon:yes stop_codon:yes gene_type:complete